MTDNNTISKLNIKPIILIIIVLAIVCLCFCVFALLMGGILYFNNKDSNSTTIPNTPFVQEVPETNPQTQTWLVMLYFDADDAILEEDMYFDLNEVEMIGSTERVQMVAQIDRGNENFTGDDDWTSARRYYLTQDNDLNAINSEVLADLGEVDMGSRDTLIDFTTWAIQTYPADNYVLIMSDHGAGWPGGWSDSSPKNSGGNWLHLNDVEYALSQTITNTGIRQFELIGMDACLMSMLEVYNSLAPYAHYAVASQETEPALGWAYTSFLGGLAERPEMSGADLGRAIVEGYINEDQRILNDEARQRMLSSYGIFDATNADEMAQEMSTTITIAAIDLSALSHLNSTLDQFLYTLKNIDQTSVANSRAYAQAFVNVFNEEYPSPYIDLSNFAEFIVQTVKDPTVEESAQQLQSALSNAVIAEKHGEQRPGARGISVYFPISELYWDETIGYAFYTESSRSSSDHTLWDDFLAYHYAGQEFGLGNPSKEARLPAPGAGQISIAPLTLSATSIQPGDILNIQTDITGDNVAYIYFVGLIKHSSENRYLLYFMDYLQYDERNQVQNGVVYPVWDQTNGSIHISLDWDLSERAVCDGTNCVTALLNPDKYTAQTENRIYYVEGWYTYAETGKRIEATMYFSSTDDFLIRNIIANPVGNDSIKSPSALIPKPGDHFLTMNTELTIDDSGKIHTTYHEGNSLTFGDQPFYRGYWGTPEPGEYVFGIYVKDKDGNVTWQFAPVTVK